MASRIVTLFSEQKITQAGSPSMVASMVAHFMSLAIFFVLLKVAVPHVVHVPPQQFSVVRVLTYQPEREQAKAGANSLRYQAKNLPAMKSAGGTQRPRQRVLPPNPKIKTGRQTILQAHANKIPPLHAVIPTVLLTAAHPKITEKIFTSPPHQDPAAPTPKLLTLPNAETHVADILLSSTAFTTLHLVLPPSTTVPYKLNRPTDNAQIVETSSPTRQAPTPTRLLTISELKLVTGVIAIPQSENEIQKIPVKGSLASGEEDRTPGAGAGTQLGTSLLRTALLSGSGTSGQHSSTITWTHASRSAQAPGGLSTAANSLNAEARTNSGSGHQLSFTHLSRSKVGHFGAVLMGDSPEQDYPETADLWTGRNAYTVYINVGTSTSWILQYSLPKSTTPAQLQGHLNAPYPYALLRPNFPASELNASALLVHGFINAEGNLVHLTVEFPPNFSLAKRILKALSQWQFRAATLDKTATKVEVLLIIPNGADGH